MSDVLIAAHKHHSRGVSGLFRSILGSAFNLLVADCLSRLYKCFDIYNTWHPTPPQRDAHSRRSVGVALTNVWGKKTDSSESSQQTRRIVAVRPCADLLFLQNAVEVDLVSRDGKKTFKKGDLSLIPNISQNSGVSQNTQLLMMIFAFLHLICSM